MQARVTDPMDDDAISQLQERLGYRFRDPALLLHALTHRSATPEDSASSNERLEFLGDAIVGFVISENLLRKFPSHREGDLAKLKAYVVSGATLAEAAHALEIDECIRMSPSESASGGRRRRSILADAFEAVVAAVYLDSGIMAARKLVNAALLERLLTAARSEVVRDHKSSLQERAQSELKLTPIYRITDEAGSDHEKLFTAEVILGDVVAGIGTGGSKKEAEQDAARAALEQFSRITADLALLTHEGCR